MTHLRRVFHNAGMDFYADLHIHSKYSRATSRHCDLENLPVWARKKGLAVIGTGDFTHPVWMGELKERLVAAEPGLFALREADDAEHATRFMLSAEISTIYKKGGRTRKVHHLICAPDFEHADRISSALGRIGNLNADGRPILKLDSRDLLEIVLESGPDAFLVPAHIWTPWFSALGSKSGFDSIDECYGDLAEHIFAVETGLSADPPMIRRLSSLDRFALVSNSDAHSPAKLGREACVFSCPLSFFDMRDALRTGNGYEGTIEFFPEEGKYHWDGHRKCGTCFTPFQSRQHKDTCPVCKKPVTLGVMRRVEDLADRSEEEGELRASKYRRLVPLVEIISEIEGVGAGSKRVGAIYEALLKDLGPELFILAEAKLKDIEEKGSELLAEGIGHMRRGEVLSNPGFDGEYGTVRLFVGETLSLGKERVSPTPPS